MSSEGFTCFVQGRIVWTVSGNVFQGKPSLDQNTKQPRMDKRGQPLVQYGFGLAVPKTVLNQCGPGQPGEIWAKMHEAAFTLYPSRQIPPGFAMKYKDGDGIDDKGAPFNTRTGYAGNLVFALTQFLPIKFYKHENGNNILINEGIKCGDYVNVQVSIEAHTAVGSAKPGLYMNPNAVQLIGFGTEIINRPTGDQIFGMNAPAVPMGASATPIAPAFNPPAAPMPQLSTSGPGGYGQFGAGQPPQQLAPAPAPAPHYAILPPQHQQPQAPAPVQQWGQPAYPGAPSPAMTPAPVQQFAPAPVQQFAPAPMSQPGFPALPGVPR